MIIPREYFQRRPQQTQMMQSPTTQVPERPTDYGSTKAEVSLYENLEGLFAKLGGVAAKVEKSNQDLAIQEKIQIKTQQIDTEYTNWLENQLPNSEWEDLDHKSVRDWFFEDEDGPKWGSEEQYSDNNRINRKVNLELNKHRQSIVNGAVKAMMLERKQRISVILDGETARLELEAQKRLFNGEDPNLTTFEAEFEELYQPLLNDGAIGKDVYDLTKQRLLGNLDQTKAAWKFMTDPSKYATKTFDQIRQEFPYARTTDLFDTWHAASEIDKDKAFRSFQEMISDNSVLPQEVSKRMKDTNPAYRKLDNEQRIKLEEGYLKKEKYFADTEELNRLKINLERSEVFRSLVTLTDKKEVIVNQEAVKRRFTDPQMRSSAIGIVKDHLKDVKGKKQEKALVETLTIQNILDRDNWTYEEIEKRINDNPDMDDSDKIQLKGYLGQKQQVREQSESFRYIENFIESDENKDKFVEVYNQVTDESGNIRSDDELGELREDRLVQEILKASPGDLHSLAKLARSDLKETARRGKLATFQKSLAQVKKSSEVQIMIDGLQERDPTIKFEDQEGLLSQLYRTKTALEDKENAEEDRKTLEKQELLQLQERNKIAQAQAPWQLMKDKDIDGLELTKYQKEYLKGVRALKEIELNAEWDREQDGIQFNKIVQKALKTKDLATFQTLKAQIQTSIGNKVNAAELETTLTRMEEGLKTQLANESANDLAKAQNLKYTEIDQAINNITTNEQIYGIDSVMAQLGHNELTDIQRALLNGKLQSMVTNLELKQPPGNDQDSSFDGSIREQTRDATKSNQINPIMKALEERATMYPDNQLPGWFHNLRSFVKERKKQLATKEQHNSLLSYAFQNWQEYRKTNPKELSEKYPLMETADFARAEKIAHDRWDAATPNWIAPSAVGGHLDNYVNWLTSRVFNPNTQKESPLIARDKEGRSLETRLGDRIKPFREMDKLALEVQQEIENVISLPTDASIQQSINEISKKAEGNEQKKRLIQPFLDIATERINSIRKMPKQTQFKDALRMLKTGHVQSKKEIRSNEWYQSERVIDGDTLVVNGRRIRLANVNTAELGTKPGKVAAEAVTELLKNRKIRLEIYGKGTYDRDIAYVWIDQKTLLQQWLIENNFSDYVPGFGPGNFAKELSAAQANR